MSDRNKPRKITKREFCELMGISEKQLERYCHDGMPHAKEGRAVTIPMPEGRVWYHKYLVAKGKAEATPTSRSDSIDRQEAANAELAEIELAKARNELMRVEDYERLVGDAFARVRARLTNLPPRIAGVVLGAKTVQEAQLRTEPIVREIMDELRAADDVPGGEDEGHAAA